MPNLFPYTNTHELNLDWILQVVKDFQTKYTTFDQALADALAAIAAGKTEALDEISTDLTAALNDIEASQTAALTAIGNTKDSALADIGTALTNATTAISALNTTVQGEITTLKNTSISEITTAQGTAISAITASMNHATTIIEQLYNTLPASAQDVLGKLDLLDSIITGSTMESFTWLQGSYIYPEGVTPPTPPAINTESPTYNQAVSSRYMTGVGGRRIRIITDGTIYMTSILTWRNTPPGGGAGGYVPGQASWFTNTYADILLPLDVTAFSIEISKPNPADTIAPTDIPGHIEIQWITDFVSQRIIAPKESSTTADVAREEGEYFFLDGDLYIATDDIAVDDTIAEGTNCEKKTVGGELAQVNGDVSELKSAINNLDYYYLRSTEDYLGIDTKVLGGITYNYTGGTWKYKDTVLDASYVGKVTLDIRGYDNTAVGHFVIYDKSFTTAIQPDGMATTQLTQDGRYTFTATDGIGIRLQASKAAAQTAKLCKIDFVGIIYGDVDFAAQAIPDALTGTNEIKRRIAYSTLQSASTKNSTTMMDCVSSAKEQSVSVTATFDAFTSLIVGVRKNANYTIADGMVNHLEITGTQAVWHYNQYGTPKTMTDNHNLTISNVIGVKITWNWATVSIKITSIGGTFEKSYTLPSVRVGKAYPFYVLTATNGVVLNFSNVYPQINKKVWVFGDSYIQDVPERWVYYTDRDLYFANGYPGEGSANAIAELTYLLTLGAPKYVVWALGMNDNDTQWNTGLSALISLSNQYKFEIVLATIPTVPTRDNETKNATVRSSNYRYIDFAKAVGANAEGEWFTGLLSDDEVHPSALGANVLAAQIYADFPEIMIK